jgi:DNA-binding transcriptional LysR family regulator
LPLNSHPNTNLKLSQLRAFVTVADCGNFGAAALELGISQSTVSHAIATLEAELGVILLVRGRHGAVLTAIGERILPDARQILDWLESIQHKANQDKGLQSGVVRIAAVRSLATHLLPDAIMQFRQTFPLINVIVRDCNYYTEIQQMLKDRQVEIGLTLLPVSSEFEAWELIHDEFVALLPEAALNPDQPLTWELLTRCPMIMNPIAVNTRLVQEHLARFDYPLHIAYEVKEDSTIMGMVKRGLGASIMARLAAEPIPDGVEVRSLPVPLERVIGAVILSNALLPQAAFAFLDVLKAVCQ